MAARNGLPLLLGDGILRSVEREDAPLSLVVEDLGIYYDASAPLCIFQNFVGSAAFFI